MRFTVKALQRYTIDFCVNGRYVFNSSQLFLIDHPLRCQPAIYAAESYSSAALWEHVSCKWGEPTGMKTFHCDNLQTWSGTWWAELFSPPLSLRQQQPRMATNEELCQCCIQGNEMRKWGLMRGKYLFSFKGIIWLRWPCAIELAQSCRWSCVVCLPVAVAGGQYLQ